MYILISEHIKKSKNVFKKHFQNAPHPTAHPPPRPPQRILKMFFKNIFRIFLYVCLLIYTYIYVSIYACHVYCQALVLVNEEEKFCRKNALKNEFFFLRKNNKKIEMCKMTF